MTLTLVPCPLCRQSDLFIDIHVPENDGHIHQYGLLYEGKTKSEWKICGQCGFVHQNPRPDIDALNEFYKQSRYHVNTYEWNVKEFIKFAHWYYSEKVEFALKYSGLLHGCVFDIGCGRGGVLKLFEERGWKSYGVEPDEHLASFASSVLELNGVQQGILDSNFNLQEKVDIVFSNHAFEHFADLDEVMKGILKIIKPDAYLFIAVPTYFNNKSSLSKAWMNSGHYSLFTHNSLNNLLSRHGFEEIAYTYSGWKKEVDDLWYLARFTSKKSDPVVYYENPETVSNYLRVINPLRSFIFFPVYSNWAMRVRLLNLIIYAVKIFLSSPALFFQKLYCFIKRKLKI